MFEQAIIQWNILYVHGRKKHCKNKMVKNNTLFFVYS